MLRTIYVPLPHVENSFRKIYGQWLQSEREKTGITQEQVAEKTKLNVKSISRIERGESGTKKETLIMIVEAINSLSHGYKINLEVALNKYGFATPNEIDGVRRRIVVSDKDGFDDQDLDEIAEYIAFKKARKEKEKA